MSNNKSTYSLQLNDDEMDDLLSLMITGTFDKASRYTDFDSFSHVNQARLSVLEKVCALDGQGLFNRVLEAIKFNLGD